MKQRRLFEAAECECCAGAGVVPVRIRDARFDKRVGRWRPVKYQLMSCMACKGTGRKR